jgi:hypothetical protein
VMWMKLMYVRVMLIKLMDMMLMMYVMYDVEEVDIDQCRGFMMWM